MAHGEISSPGRDPRLDEIFNQLNESQYKVKKIYIVMVDNEPRLEVEFEDKDN